MNVAGGLFHSRTAAMNRPSDSDEDFEAYRREKNYRRLKHQAPGRGPDSFHSKAMRAIEEDERQDCIERQLQREMMDFVENTTKIAARILSEITEEQAQMVHRKISTEMKEFFNATLARAEKLVDYLRQKYGAAGIPEGELEAHLKDLSTNALDAFRAEGSETANMLHMGEDPGEVPHAPPPQEAKKSAQDPGEAPVKLETIPDLHRPASDAGDMLDLDVELEDPMASNVGDDTCELEPIEDYDFEQEEREVAAQKSARSWRAGKGGPSGSTALSQPEESCEDVEEEDEHRDAMDPLLPGPFAKLADDPPRLKKALALMVKNGLMERQEARSIYAKARASKV